MKHNYDIENLKNCMDSYLRSKGINPDRNFACPVCGGGQKTPCTVYYEDTKEIHCFSCGWHGDVINLISAEYGIGDTAESLRKAAEVLGFATPHHPSTNVDKCRTVSTDVEKGDKCRTVSTDVEKGDKCRIVSTDVEKGDKCRTVSTDVEKGDKCRIVSTDVETFIPLTEEAKSYLSGRNLLWPAAGFRSTADGKSIVIPYP